MSGKRLLSNLRRGAHSAPSPRLPPLSALPLGLEIYFEHFRRSFGDKWMWTPVALSPLLTAGLAGVRSPRAARTVLPAVSALYCLDGPDRRLHPHSGHPQAAWRLLRAALQHHHGTATAGARVARARRRHGPHSALADRER
jgi:hypothetical protein